MVPAESTAVDDAEEAFALVTIFLYVLHIVVALAPLFKHNLELLIILFSRNNSSYSATGIRDVSFVSWD